MKGLHGFMCMVLLLYFLIQTVSSINIRHGIVRNPMKVITDEIRSGIIIERKKRQVISEHDRVRRDLFYPRVNQDNDNEAAAKIRSLIFKGVRIPVRIPRQNSEEQITAHNLDQSIEDRWKLEQSAHQYEREKRGNDAALRPYFLSSHELSSRVLKPIRETRSPGNKQKLRPHVEEKRNINTLMSVVRY